MPDKYFKSHERFNQNPQTLLKQRAISNSILSRYQK